MPNILKPYAGLATGSLLKARTLSFWWKALPPHFFLLLAGHGVLSYLLWANFLSWPQSLLIGILGTTTLFALWWLPLANKIFCLGRDLRPQFPRPVWSPDYIAMIHQNVEQAGRDVDAYAEDLYKENQKFSALIESLNDPIVAVGPKGEILFYNLEFGKRFCPSPFRLLNYGRLFHEVYSHPQVQMLIDNLRAGKPVQEIFALKLKRDGQYLGHFDIRHSELRQAQQKGKGHGHVIVFHDVRSRKLADKMREDFVANISHEVRTPLTALNGFLQILEEENQRANFKAGALEAMNKIRHNAHRLNDLFNDILQLSVIESDSELVLEDVVLEEMCATVVASVEKNFPDREHKVSIEIAPDAQIVTANPRWLEQVLTNLIENAFKYIPTPGIIHIKWWAEDNQFCCTVSDNGPGIPEKYQARIFERFFRVDQARSKDIPGTGLGLAIVKHIIMKHNGSIEVSSRPGSGTAFTFKIPMSLAAQNGLS